MTNRVLPSCCAILLSAVVVPNSVVAQGMLQGQSVPSTPNAAAGLSYNTGAVYSQNYPQVYGQDMSGMTGGLPGMSMHEMPGIPYVTNPYGGMFGSMGNVYSPYYRPFHQSGMGGPLGGMTHVPGMHYNINPYAGMYGSMGNVYSPYYRQFHQSGMGGMAGAPIPGVSPGQGVRYHYPYFLPPAMGGM